MAEKAFKFELGQEVALVESGESGHIVGRAEFVNSDNSYRVRYLAADRRQVEDWWLEDAIRAA